ncbi:MAG: translocation/assembly module TamB domain-containing protein [Acidobacteria bacterium]|nr:translocation/assembly module TamB domain-containing protein [Acidobacteriota bacterium]
MDEEVERSLPPDDPAPEPPARPFLTRRRLLFGVGIVAVAVLVVFLSATILYRTGFFDSYIKDQLTAKMAEIGITFSADKFRVSASPLSVELRNATFNNATTGEKLFFIREAKLGLTVLDLLSWSTSRDIRIDSTDIEGGELWITFDKDGRSNFSGLHMVEDQKGSAVNFRYESVAVSLKDSVVHFGDVSRNIAADANELSVELTPDTTDGSTDGLRFKFDLNARNSNFGYGEGRVENISILAKGIADETHAEVSDLQISSPIGDTVISGTITDWAHPRYDLNADSSLDLTQLSQIFATGTALRGVGNFKGKISGEGEKYRVEGTASSEAFRAAGVYLKGANIAATVEGTNANYTANGTAIAEMLTFDDFRLDVLKLAGNVRGTGTDFRWVGELQAIAARTPSMTIGKLFLADAVAEYRDKELAASAVNGRAQRFAIGDTEFEDLQARGLKVGYTNGDVTVSSNSATAGKFSTEDYSIGGVKGGAVDVRHRKGQTDVTVNDLHAADATLGDSKVKNLTAKKFELTDVPAETRVKLQNVRGDDVAVAGMRINGLESPLLETKTADGTTVIYSDSTRIAKLDSDAATLGSLNIAGVRLTIRQGRVEGRSQDIDAGSVTLKNSDALANGGNLENVKLARPVFILEPSGRYRASADMSIGGGALGSIALGDGKAKVVVTSERAELSDLHASVMNGSLDGQVSIAFRRSGNSTVDTNFTGLDLSKLAAIQSGRVIPLEGSTNGSVHLTFAGTNFRASSGTVEATIAATAGSDADDKLPISGRIDLAATDGLFRINEANFQTDKSRLNATGQFDLSTDNSDLAVKLSSSDASEITKLVHVTGAFPALETQLDSMQAEIGGSLAFDGHLSGAFLDPDINGKASIERVALRGRTVGSVSSDLIVSADGFKLENGRLTEPGGGFANFDVTIPSYGSNNTTVNADLTNINAGNLLAALPIDLPARIKDLSGSTSGRVSINGLPNAATGDIDLSADNGLVAGQNFDSLKAKAIFAGSRIEVQNVEMNIGDGRLTAQGQYDRGSKDFDAKITGKAIPVPLILAFLPPNDSIPVIGGNADVSLVASGNADRFSTVNVTGSGTAADVTVGENSIGNVNFDAKTVGGQLTANLTADFSGHPQSLNATLDLTNDDLPLQASTEFRDNPLEPFLAFIPKVRDFGISGTARGRVDFGGNLSTLKPDGTRTISAENLSGTARFDALSLQIQDTPLNAAEPIVAKLSANAITFESAHFTGAGSDIRISGTKAISDTVENRLAVEGKMNLALLNLATKDLFFAGNADVSVRLVGLNPQANLTGSVATENAAFAAFVGNDRLTFSRVKARVIFTSDQAEIEEASGYLGGGKFTATAGALLDGLSIRNFRSTLNGENVTVPFPEDFLTTGDARLEITGVRRSPADPLQTTISGRVYASRSLYTKDIDLANIVGGRRARALSAGTSSLTAPRFDLVIEGRNALVVRNNIADLTASVSLNLSGDTDNPILSGRIVANGGTLLYRRDRYEIQRGVLEFPPDTFIDPVVNLQAEAEIGGYQVFVSLNGPLNDTEQVTASVRSSPALPQADIVSLITTGSLTNAAGGIPTLAQTGIRTAAEILTDAVINNPARRATDKLFGLNVFEIDPILAGEQLNPGARLTVGRQINNNLRVTYATNLSQDQNQVLALEYRVSNKLSFVAQYEQRSLTNVTRNRDNFSFEIRFKRRF